MSSFEKLIGDAMMSLMTGDDSTVDLSMARVTVKAAASRLIFCPRCGSVMDQSRTIVVETMAGDRETDITATACGSNLGDGDKCEPNRAFLLKTALSMRERWPDREHVWFRVNTWDGIETIP